MTKFDLGVIWVKSTQGHNLNNSGSTPIHDATYWGWSGGAMVLGKLPVPGRPTIWVILGQGPIALAVGAGGGLFGHFFSSLFFLLFLPLSGRRPNIN